MSISAYASHMKINELLKRWKANPNYHFNAFIDDGIVSPPDYASPHILFVLREKNDSSPCDLRENLGTYGCKWQTWNNIGRWTKALLDGSEEYPRAIDRVPYLRKIAAININKDGGGPRTDKTKLRNAAEMQHREILEEINLCDPHIIICCGLGTAELLKEYVFTDDASAWMSDLSSQFFKRTWYYYTVSIDEKTVPVIDFCHPQVTNLEGKRGHDDLFEPLYRDMVHIKSFFAI